MEKLEGKDVKQTTDQEGRKCPMCGGRLEAKNITHPQYYEGKVVILENVPAEVCRQCGEVLLSPDVAGRFQEAVWSGKSATRTAQVPVYDLAEM